MPWSKGIFFSFASKDAHHMVRITICWKRATSMSMGPELETVQAVRLAAVPHTCCLNAPDMALWERVH